MVAGAYAALLTELRPAALLDASAAILGWDQETMLPAGGVDLRAAQLEQLSRLAHELRTDPRVADRLQAAAEDPVVRDDPDGVAARSLAELARRHARLVRLPSKLVGALSETTSLAQHHWAQARGRNDFAQFAPWLERVLALHREKAACLAGPETGEAWDALADEYEPGLTAAAFSALIERLHPGLRSLRERILARTPRIPLRAVPMPVATQEKFVRFVAASMGFDFARGRIDRSTHPFCGGSHAGDVRITTRYRESDLLDGLGSTMHEVGHALYEQGLDAQAFGTPAGEAASLGVHESQSRLWENQVGRSAAFWRWAAPYATEFLAPGSRPLDPVSLWAAANHVVPGAIRVDADPVHYDLHVGIRFELERRMLRGELPVAKLPAEWRRRMREQIGIEIRSDREGCLQDVHWAAGLIGYFPTYTLGNVYAAQLWAAAERALGSLPAQIECGEFAPLLGWLRQHVHRHGHLYAPAELIERATGAAPDPAFLLADLEQRLAPLYGL